MFVKGVYLCETSYCCTASTPSLRPHPPYQSKTDIKFWSIWRILVEGVGCLHHPPWGWYRADHPLPESREFDFSKLKWRRTEVRFRSDNINVSSTRQAQGLDCYWVGCTVVWLRSSGWSAQSPWAVHRLLESLVGTRLFVDTVNEHNLNGLDVKVSITCPNSFDKCVPQSFFCAWDRQAELAAPSGPHDDVCDLHDAIKLHVFGQIPLPSIWHSIACAAIRIWPRNGLACASFAYHLLHSVGCNNDIGGFNENLVIFERSKPDF